MRGITPHRKAGKLKAEARWKKKGGEGMQEGKNMSEGRQKRKDGYK